MNNTACVRSTFVAVLCGALLPFGASAAGLTVTQQGIASASASKGAQRAVFLDVSLRAECDSDVTVAMIMVTHRGLGDAADVVRVYATDDDVRRTRTRSLDSSDRTAALRFLPPLVIAKCSTKRIQVRGDFSAEAAVAGQHRLVLEGITADAPVTLTSGKLTTITTRPVSAGTLSVSMLPAPRILRFGKDRTLARIRLDADTITNHRVSSVILTNDGKATDGDVKNIRLENRRGAVLTNVAETLDGSTVTLTFDPVFFINRNNSILLYLKGDIDASKKRTIQFVVEEPSDVQAASDAR